MRIVGGRFSGRRLASVGDGAPAVQLRPTSDRIREAIFNLLAHGDYPPIDGARVLDLFAGTGALGFEALSRGAAWAVFIEDHPKSRGLIRENIEALGLTGATKLFRRDATRLGPHRGAPFELIFLDPPYGRDLAGPAIASAIAGGWAAESAVFILEQGQGEAPPALDDLIARDERRYGDTVVRFFAMGAS